VPSSTPQIGTTVSTGAGVGIGVVTPLAKLDITTSVNLGALNLRGRNTLFPGNPTTEGTTPFALKVEFNQTVNSPIGVFTTALLDCHGKLFLGEFNDYTSAYNLNTQSNGIAVFGTGPNKLSLTYNSGYGTNLISWQSDSDPNAPLDRKNLGFAYDNNAPFFNLTPQGQVLIGTREVTGTHRLYVAGSAIAEEVVVKLQANWPDYVFAPAYNMLSTAELRNYIQTNGKLPYLADAQSVAQDGLPLGETQAQLTRLVEELTLRLLEMDERIEELESQLAK